VLLTARRESSSQSRYGTRPADVRTAVITIVHGRHEHLRMHLRGLAASTTLPYSHVIVAMGDETVKNIVAQERSSAHVVEIDVPEGDPLPLARARNIGAAKARCHGAELLVFLDVDCIAAPTLLARYHETASEENSTASLFCGPVTYLTQPLSSPITPDEMALLHNPHPARPAPRAGTVLHGDDFNLFWSLSFAVTVPTWLALQGFCEEYRGYGGEDTDFAWSARDKGVKLTWVGGADAYHQFHHVSDPPIEHLDNILTNAQVFHQRWGQWPMQGWIDAFEERGLVEYRPDLQTWVRIRN
jgi:GT2 family glycosyltransferase